MELLAASAFCFLVGMTLCGIAGSLLELLAGARLSFAAPFLDRLHKTRFALAIVTAGPLMLGNDALEAWRHGRIATPVLMCCAATVAVWSLAMGTVLVGLLSRFVAIA